MSIKIKIPSILQELTMGNDTIEVSNVANVGQVINKLEQKYPGLKAQLFDVKGNLSSIYDIYVNGESIYPHELTTPLKDGDLIAIVMLYVGG